MTLNESLKPFSKQKRHLLQLTAFLLTLVVRRASVLAWAAPVFNQSHDFHFIILNFLAEWGVIALAGPVYICFHRAW